MNKSTGNALEYTLSRFTHDEYLRGLNREEWRCNFIQNNLVDHREFPFDNLRIEWVTPNDDEPITLIAFRGENGPQTLNVTRDALLGQMVHHLVQSHGYDPDSAVCGLEPARHALLRACVALLMD